MSRGSSGFREGVVQRCTKGHQWPGFFLSLSWEDGHHFLRLFASFFTSGASVSQNPQQKFWGSPRPSWVSVYLWPHRSWQRDWVLWIWGDSQSYLDMAEHGWNGDWLLKRKIGILFPKHRSVKNWELDSKTSGSPNPNAVLYSFHFVSLHDVTLFPLLLNNLFFFSLMISTSISGYLHIWVWRSSPHAS